MLVTSSAKVVEVSKEIGRYKVVTGAKINYEKSVGLQLGSWKGCALPSSFSQMDGLCKILGIWFGLHLQLEKNWSEVLEDVVTVTALWLRRRLFLNGWAEICLYHLSVLPILCTILFKFERILFQLI